MDQVHDDYSAKGVHIQYISRDTDLTLPMVKPFFEANQYPFDVIIQPNYGISEAMNVSMVPHVVVVAPENHVIYERIGFKPDGTYMRDLRYVLDKVLGPD